MKLLKVLMRQPDDAIKANVIGRRRWAVWMISNHGGAPYLLVMRTHFKRRFLFGDFPPEYTRHLNGEDRSMRRMRGVCCIGPAPYLFDISSATNAKASKT